MEFEAYEMDGSQSEEYGQEEEKPNEEGGSERM
jgi:hypothetical protein